MMGRIGIMGGTFNPIHNGHLSIAETARAQFSLERVLFMPSGVPYMKDQQEVLPIDIRCEMTALAIAAYPYFALSTLEAADAVQGKNTYTFETLQKLRRADPEADYYFILGADSLYAIEEWKNPALIFENCTLLAAVRAAQTPVGTKAQPSVTCGNDEPAADEGNDTPSQSRLLQQVRYLREKYHASVEILEFAGLNLSSTQIREMARCGQSIHGLVPDAVERYLLSNKYY